ncbi:cysteine-rich motor neuron 1 protein-like isoform X2 [Clytia hemisphaerica]|uniref:VWFC domain-containing protein n=1 Tax=Clytia hemisphaerica TaxID=252671 RepID=A0A7M5X4Q2_9CNID
MEINKLRSYFGIIILSIVLLANVNTVNSTCAGRQEGEQWTEGSCKVCFCHRKRVTCGTICGRGKAISDAIQKNLDIQSAGNNLITAALANSKFSCYHDGRKRLHLESWQETNHHASLLKQKNQECMLCQCKKNMVSCTVRFCPRVACANPVRKKGTCCKHCPDSRLLLKKRKGCEYFGSVFDRGSQWTVYIPNSRQNHCLECSCKKKGCRPTYACQRKICPVLRCREQVNRPGNCCKTCKDDLTSQQQIIGNHQLENIQHDNLYNTQQQHSSSQGETFTFFDSLKDDRSLSPSQKDDNEDDDDNDDKCNDENDEEDKTRRPTSQLTKKPLTVIKITEKPIKPKKTYCDFGKIYKNGESFIPEGFNCLRCSCKNSNVTCGRVFCPVTYTCKNPRRQKGLCCKICPGTSRSEALKTEERDVRPLMKPRKSCSRNRKEDRIQVFEYESPTSLLGGRMLNNYFLFDRSQMTPPGRSEIHSLKFTAPNMVDIAVDQITSDSESFFSKWKYIGSVKTKVLERVHRHEKNLKSAKSLHRYNNLVKLIKEKAAKGKVHRRGGRCERKSTGEHDTIANQELIKTLKEIRRK